MQKFTTRGALALLISTLACDADPPEAEHNESGLLRTTTYGDTNNNSNSFDLPERTVILTFDDGPDGAPWSVNADMTLAIAQFLANEGIQATFFVNGRRFLGQSTAGGCALSGFNSNGNPQLGHTDPNFRQYPESNLTTLVQLGHVIANHTHDHCMIGGVVNGVNNQQFLSEELRPTQEVLDRHAPGGPYLFRPPYGGWSVPAAQDAWNDLCLDKLEGPVNWDIDGGDWGCWTPRGNDLQGRPIPNRTVEQCLQAYVDSLNLRTRRNGVVLHHDRPEFAVNVADYYNAANNYAPMQIPLLGNGVSYANNELGLVQAWVAYLKANNYTFGRIEQLYNPKRVRNWSCGDYSDADSAFNSNPGYYRSFQLADVTGDGYADACGRFSDGVYCAPNRRNGQFETSYGWMTSDYSDGLGWLPLQYGSTVQFAQLTPDNRADMCGRGGIGLLCARSNGDFFEPVAWASTWPDFADGSGWAGGESYYGSLHLADVNGDGVADACARASNGIVCGMNTSLLTADHAIHFTAATLWLGSDFTDALGWYPPQYGATVQFADLNNDQRADVCGRGGGGMLCALSQSSGGFGSPTVWTTWPDFSDNDLNAAGWQQPYYYKSIQLTDVNGDNRADVCGRTAQGIVCALSTGTGFGRYAPMTYPGVWTNSNDYGDNLGWANDIYGSTIRFGRLDGDTHSDVCGRGGRGLLCGLSP